MKNVSNFSGISMIDFDIPFEGQAPEVNDLSNTKVELHNPEQLSKFLEWDAFKINPNFAVAEVNQFAQLKAAGPAKILVIPSLSLCFAVVLHNKERDSWLTLHCTLNDTFGPVKAFNAKDEDPMLFLCDKVVLINGPILSEKENEVFENEVQKSVFLTGAIFEGGATEIDCAFSESFAQRRGGLGEERRTIMVVPEAHSIYIFNEKGQHLETHAL